jgi:hypothetical protein
MNYLCGVRRGDRRSGRAVARVLRVNIFYSHDGFYTRKQPAIARHEGVPVCHLHLPQEGAKDRDMSDDVAKKVVHVLLHSQQ